MAFQSTVFNVDFLRLLEALQLFEQTFGPLKTELELQATIGALAASMNLVEDNLDDYIHQVSVCYKQPNQPADPVDKPIEENLKENPIKAPYTAIQHTVQTARERLAAPAATLLLLVRTYLQRVSSKLSADEFVDLIQAAIALLAKEQAGPTFSLAEGKRLLYIALQTFGTQLSQPIPSLGEQLPESIVRLVMRLTRYQAIIGIAGPKADLVRLVNNRLKNTTRPLSPGLIHAALSNSTSELTRFDQAELDDLSSILLFKVQLQASSPVVTESDQEIAEQLHQAIHEFQTKYRALPDITQPRWDDELSVSSPWFNSNNFETASSDFVWIPPKIEEESSKDETNS